MKDGGQRPTSWEECVSWARRKWETLYNNDIRQLLHCFPPEQVKSLQGEKKQLCLKPQYCEAVIYVCGHRGALLCL